MTDTRFAASLNAFVRRQPFRPFMIEFHSGERLKIGHPEIVVIEAGGVVRYNKGRTHRLFDATSVSELLDIEE